MRPKHAKSRQGTHAARQSIRDAAAITRRLKAENWRLRYALIKIAEQFEGDESAMIALKALGPSLAGSRSAGGPRYTLAQLLAECEEAGGLPVLQEWDAAAPVGRECLEPGWF